VRHLSVVYYVAITIMPPITSQSPIAIPEPAQKLTPIKHWIVSFISGFVASSIAAAVVFGILYGTGLTIVDEFGGPSLEGMVIAPVAGIAAVWFLHDVVLLLVFNNGYRTIRALAIAMTLVCSGAVMQVIANPSSTDKLHSMVLNIMALPILYAIISSVFITLTQVKGGQYEHDRTWLYIGAAASCMLVIAFGLVMPSQSGKFQAQIQKDANDFSFGVFLPAGVRDGPLVQPSSGNVSPQIEFILDNKTDNNTTYSSTKIIEFQDQQSLHEFIDPSKNICSLWVAYSRYLQGENTSYLPRSLCSVIGKTKAGETVWADDSYDRDVAKHPNGDFMAVVIKDKAVILLQIPYDGANTNVVLQNAIDSLDKGHLATQFELDKLLRNIR
jgi:hypothetical protein